jgi:alpha-L-fucosidase
MNNSFGYTEGDKAYKGAPVHIRQLVECVSKGGNYLLNVGPDAKGNFPPEARRTLREMGEWMRLNGESIYGCGPGRPAEAFGCRTTAKGNKLYLHVMHLPVGPLPVSGVRPEEIKYARLLSTGAEVEVLSEGWAVQNYPGYTFLNLGVSWGEAFPMPAEADIVVELTLRD